MIVTKKKSDSLQSYFQQINKEDFFEPKSVSYKVLIVGKSFVQGSSTCVLLTVPFHESQKHFLFDTGTSYDREKLLIALKECRLTPNDIDCVFLSHWHIDHIGNADLFPNALLIASAETFDAIQKIQEVLNHGRNSVKEISEYFIGVFKRSGLSFTLSKIRAISVLTLKHQKQIRSIANSYAEHKTVIITEKKTCFENTICIYKTNTHTDGDIVIKICCYDKVILITGDCIISRQELNKHPNSLLQFGSNNVDLIIPGHDSCFSVQSYSK